MNRLIYHFLDGRFGAGIEIRILMHRTARTFGVKTPKTAGLSASELLERYAGFTAAAARYAVESGQDLKNLHRELYHTACRLGSTLRRWMRPENEQECCEILVLLYRNIGIKIREEQPRKFRVDRCYFSAFYTPEICQFISALDAGIFAGIFGGGRLKFQERITDGAAVCRADFT